MIREFFVTAAIGVASLSSAAAPTERTDQTPKASDEVVERALAKHLFKMLPREEQRRIRVARGLPADPSRFADGASRDFVGPLDPRIERLTPYASVEVLSRIDERMLNFLALTHEEAQRGPVSAQACFTPGTDPAVVEIIESIYRENGERFVLTSRWAATATNPAPLFDNNPITLTYSFVPDGTPVTDRFSTPPGGPAVQVGSNLFSWLNGIYGSPAVWQALFARVFDDWSALTGTTYVFEPMDDGVPVDDGLFGPPVNNGILGQRGDVRINAIPLDGPGGTLAFNLFPQSGDMTFDSADTSYASNAGINDDIFFRNVTAHEHGHGLGLLHTCPLDGTKLMEPFIQLGFDGPQFDDVLGASVRYGDRTEPNGTIGQAIGLGTSSKVASTVENVSINFNAELDFFTFSVPSGSTAIFEAIPVGPDGLSGAQLASGCGVGTPVDFSAIADLRIEVVSPAPETIDRLLAGGTERLVVRNDSGSTQNYTVAIASTTPSTLPEALFDAQAYTASLRNVAAAADLAPAARFLDEDTRNLPGQNSLVFDLSVIPVLASIPPTSVEVALTTSNPPSQLFATAEFVSGNTYRADFGTLACGPDYQVEATVQFENAPSVTSSVTVDRENDLAAGDFFDSFEANRGWLALNAFAANEGLWQRGVPVNFGRGDPPADSDGNGFAFLTENDPNGSNSDVDGGPVDLISPRLDLTGGGTISWDYWVGDVAGFTPFDGTTGVTVDLSFNDGTTFINQRNYNVATNAWTPDSIVVSPAEATDQIRIRFRAQDTAATVMEAGVDAFRVDIDGCDQVCPIDFASPFGVVSNTDVDEFVARFFAADSAVDLASPFGVISNTDVDAFVALFFDASCVAP